MFLTQLTEKKIYVNNNFRGVCKGVALSLNSHAVRYLLCASSALQSNPDFAVSVSSINKMDTDLHLSRLRPARPANCAKIILGAPVYSFEGGYLGRLADLELHDFIATKLFTDRGENYPITSVFACSDAVILRKEQPYPLGQRIPAPYLSPNSKPNGVVTKAVLRKAIEKGSLVKLTLSLPPFAPLDGIFGGKL